MACKGENGEMHTKSWYMQEQDQSKEPGWKGRSLKWIVHK